jgi:hypothetical protein
MRSAVDDTAKADASDRTEACLRLGVQRSLPEIASTRSFAERVETMEGYVVTVIDRAEPGDSS